MSRETHIAVREATIADANLLAQLGAQTFDETFAADNTSEDMAAYIAVAFNPAVLTAELSDKATCFLIVEVDGVAAGYAKLQATKLVENIEGAKPIELVRLYVLRNWLGRGVGHALMNRCLEEARERGYKTIWLGVWERNARAQAFYRKWNFRPVGEHVFQLGSDAQTDILMERAI